MALRLKKDVQKASYYVWFLGAQEARGLRGSRVLLPAIPRLVERSNEQEPLKVTLQVSHKGLKIIQGSSKHFIPHSAITCSVQTEDIVACVLLLYNPATRCPLHVHAYRCDSEATAEALNQQLQILINRPENQKRFADLESRLGLDASAAAAAAVGQQQQQQSTMDSRSSADPSHRQSSKSRSMSPPPPVNHHSKQQQQSTTRLLEHAAAPVSRMSSGGRFDIGSDTGTSTRESDCGSDENQHHHHSNHPHHSSSSPVLEKATLFDDLAAELREKLNGNGPPLLLPPRDYDTVHRAKGNLAASELRRCQNQMIVGAGTKGSKTTGVSSRGSSGIGSSDNMAPSPERHDGQTSSDEDWTNDHQESEIVMQPPIKRAPIKEISLHKPIVVAQQQHHQQPTQYLYPREPPRNEKFTDDEQQQKAIRHNSRQTYRPPAAPLQQHSNPPHPFVQPQHMVSKHQPQPEEPKSRRSSVTSREEEEVRPILMKNRPSYNPQRFRDIFHDEQLPPTAPKPQIQRQHFGESPEQEEEEEEEVVHHHQQINQQKRNIVRRLHSREFEPEEAPLKFEKHFPRPVLIDRSSSSGRQQQPDDPHSSSDNRSYREMPPTGLVEKKFIRSESSSKERHGRGISPQPQQQQRQQRGPIPRDMKYKPDYYDDEAERGDGSTDRGTTSSLEKFMMRQSGPAAVGKLPPTKATHYKEPAVQAPPQHPHHPHEKEVTYRAGNDEYFFERNPYREPESQPYRESIEKMLKSPVMRYNSFDEPPYVGEEQPRHSGRFRGPVAGPNNNHFDYPPQSQQQQHSSRRYAPGESPVRRPQTEEMAGEMAKLNVSPKDRFRDAKEKFQQMEKPRQRIIEQPISFGPPPPTTSAGAMPRRSHEAMAREQQQQQMTPPSSIGKGQPIMAAKREREPNERMLIGNMNSLHRNRGSNGGGGGPLPTGMRPSGGGAGGAGPRRGHEWSSEEDNERDHAMMREMHGGQGGGGGGGRNGGGKGYREIPTGERYPGLDRPDGGRLAPAKSLGNLVKGYRHSYAEPHNMLSRSSGRVGLAAVNPY